MIANITVIPINSHGEIEATPTKKSVAPQRIARRRKSAAGFSPVTFASYPLNHQQKIAASAQIIKKVGFMLWLYCQAGCWCH